MLKHVQKLDAVVYVVVEDMMLGIVLSNSEIKYFSSINSITSLNLDKKY